LAEPSFIVGFVESKSIFSGTREHPEDDEVVASPVDGDADADADADARAASLTALNIVDRSFDRSAWTDVRVASRRDDDTSRVRPTVVPILCTSQA
jgi:hypothetical protein